MWHMGPILDGTCWDQTRVPWLRSRMCDSGFPFPQIMLTVGQNWGWRDPQTHQFYLVIFHSAFFPLPEAVSL